MKKIIVNGREFVLSITAGEIDAAVTRLAGELSRDLAGVNPLFLAILNGAFIFASDLLRRLTFPCNVSFIKLSSYSGTRTTEQVTVVSGLAEEVRDRTVVIVDDIIDSGITVDWLIKELQERGAEEVRIAALLFKKDAFRKNFHIDYLGLIIPNDFIVGYGLDYDGYGRNYPDIYKIDRS
jgi:hypoxanthine phosphoribosyltransferase